MAVKDNNVKVENLKNVSDAPVSGAIPFPTLEKLVSSKVDETPQDIVLEKDGSEVHNPNRHFINSFGDDSTENKNLTVQNVSIINDGLANEVNQQHCGNEVSVNLENDMQNISTDVRLSLSGTDISAASADDHIEIQKWSTESNAGLDVVNVSNSLCNEPVKIQELDLGLHCINSFGNDCNENQKFTAQSVSMINDGLANELNQQRCDNEVSVHLENDTQDVSPDVRLSLSRTDISAASGHGQSNAGFDVVNVSNNLCTEIVKIQETSTATDMEPLDSCSDEVIIVSPERSDDQGFLDDVSRKEDESQLFEGTRN